MPELPEVETTRRGIVAHVEGRRVVDVIVRERRLRWPVSTGLRRDLPGHAVRSVERRAKYLLLRTDVGTVILHLGMSGTLRVLSDAEPAQRHDHVDLVLEGRKVLRLRDPRRFGAVLWTRRDPAQHRLLADLGPEPLDGDFDGEHLHRRSRGRRIALRDFLLDGRVVAGVGNIYANEAAFRAGIDPRRAAGRISLERYQRLAGSVISVLEAAVEAGGTTLRDFLQADGKPGFFKQQLRVYGRDGEPCDRCCSSIRRATRGSRSLFYCRECQR